MLQPRGTGRLSFVPGLAASVALVAGVGLAACSGGASTIPSIALPSVEASLSVTGSGVTGCVDPATFAILNQLQTQGANVPDVLSQNKDALVSGLQSFTPPDQATTTWRDQLVTALQSGDMTTAANEVQMLVSGQVTLTSC